MAASKATDSAGAAGYVKDFLSSAGINVDDPATIQAISDDPKLLLSYISAHRKNVDDFVKFIG